MDRDGHPKDDPRSSKQVTRPADPQGELFPDQATHPDPTLGYRGPMACRAAGITYRQLDYWARTGLVVPSVRGAQGSGSQRLYSFRDVLVLKVIKRLLDAGVSLQQIRSAVERLHELGVRDLSAVTIMSDGASVYACTSPDEVVDLMHGGHGVFGIAVGRVWREVEAELVDLPAESADDARPSHADELAARRQRRAASGS